MQIATSVNLNDTKPLKITVLGATGNVGSRVITEALNRGHYVTAVVRDTNQVHQLPQGVSTRVADASQPEDVVKVSNGQDVVISAVRPNPGDEGEANSTTRAILDGLAKTGVRLLVVGGAATLRVPGSGGKTVLQDADYLPVAARHIGQASAEQFKVCLNDDRVDWAYLSPPAQLEPGERTGRYRIGIDDLLLDADGQSKISMEDLSVALLDEAERPRHHKARFTVAY
jgi:putative NADH-flavin reductase